MPWFGGSAAVWSTCLVFYQVALLAGYFYARLLTRFLSARAQALTHSAVLLVSLLLLPIGPGESWRLTSPAHPSWLIVRMLTVTIGLAFAAMSATSPLLQTWYARAGSRQPYRLFAVSNIASLVALLAYPAIIEPLLGVSGQRIGWSMAYVIFVAMCLVTAWSIRHAKSSAETEADDAPSPRRRLQWFALSACGSMLLLSVTNHIDENVAAVPLMWVLPLAIYLLKLRRHFWIGVDLSAFTLVAISRLRPWGARLCHLQHQRADPNADQRPDLFGGPLYVLSFLPR